MIPLVSAAEMQALDKEAQDQGIPGLVLMEQATSRAWQDLGLRLAPFLSAGTSLVFLVGPGNNGGDALSLARLALEEGHICRILLVRKELSDLGQIQMRALDSWLHSEGASCDICTWPEGGEERLRQWLSGSCVVIDGLLGLGFQGEPRQPIVDILDMVEALPEGRTLLKVSLDCPSAVTSGMGPQNPVFRADLTYTFGEAKDYLYFPYQNRFCGEIKTIPLGIPKGVNSRVIRSRGFLLRPGEEPWILPRNQKWNHKYDKGHGLVLAGSPGRSGAALLSTRACQTACGVVTLLCEPETHGAALAQLQTPLMQSLGAGGLQTFLDQSIGTQPPWSAVLAGPGWGRGPGRKEDLVQLLERPWPLVLDADALALLKELLVSEPESRLASWGLSGRNSPGPLRILTPHSGELSRLLDIPTQELLSSPLAPMMEFSQKYNVYLLQKAHNTIVTSPDGSWWIVEGTAPGLATGGSGDVLAGLITGLLARGLEASLAILLALDLHQQAGRRAQKHWGCFEASQLPPLLAKIQGDLFHVQA